MHRLTAIASAFILASAVTALAEDAAMPVAVGAHLVQDPNGAELSFDLSQPVEPRVYVLAAPDRIVVESAGSQFSTRPLSSAGSRQETPWRSSRHFDLASCAGKSQIIIDLGRPACPDRVESKPILAGASPSRLEIAIKPCDQAAFAALPRPPEESTGGPEPSARAAQPVIVLDPGHGGSDGGARGIGGALEKTLVLAFCDELKRQLEVDYAIFSRYDARPR